MLLLICELNERVRERERESLTDFKVNRLTDRQKKLTKWKVIRGEYDHF